MVDRQKASNFNALVSPLEKKCWTLALHRHPIGSTWNCPNPPSERTLKPTGLGLRLTPAHPLAFAITPSRKGCTTWNGQMHVSRWPAVASVRVLGLGKQPFSPSHLPGDILRLWVNRHDLASGPTLSTLHPSPCVISFKQDFRFVFIFVLSIRAN